MPVTSAGDVVAPDMADRTALMFGALLHDIGKVVYRGSSERGTHSKLGADFLRQIAETVAASRGEEVGEDARRVIEQVRYHHATEMAHAPLADDSLAYVTYFADNVSAGMDRKNEGDERDAASFRRDVRLRKIFNIVSGHHDDNVVEPPADQPHMTDYNAIRERVRKNLLQTDIAWEQVNSLVNMLEATVSYVPSSTNVRQLVDVSLYDHLKTTAGIAACIYDVLREDDVTNFRAALFDQRTSPAYYEKQMFLLYSCDMSGIQDFIYTISGNGALKQLRARSMYLELLLEHIVDELLERLALSRANLLYTGGGHAYLLLPNTRAARQEIKAFQRELQSWFLSTYRNDLYVAGAWVACSADDLANKPDRAHADGRRFRDLFRTLSRRLSEAKACRYTASEIAGLNFGGMGADDHERECTECHRSDLAINEEGKCSLCASLGAISKQLVNKDVFVVSAKAPVVDGAQGLALPFGRWLYMYDHARYKREKPASVRVYTKNDWNMGVGLATHIWMADYTYPTGEDGISEYALTGASLADEADGADEARGIARLGVLRADVDNLGTLFVNGLPDDKVSISRTATLSRALSFFFKREVNEILKAGDYRAQVIYSGGDDLFVIGNWSDVIHAGIDIRHALDEYTGNGTLTLSAGIGMYGKSYPIARMAQETGDLEDAAKLFKRTAPQPHEKDAVALWTEDATFTWDELSTTICDRMSDLRSLLGGAEKGKAFIYRVVDLLRDDDGVSAPRLAYLLARSFEGVGGGEEATRKIYTWAMDARERKLLLASLVWYVYSIRERG